jgi:hypothetical protein
MLRRRIPSAIARELSFQVGPLSWGEIERCVDRDVLSGVNPDGLPRQDTIGNGVPDERVAYERIAGGCLLSQVEVHGVLSERLLIGGIWIQGFHFRDKVLVEEELSDVYGIVDVVRVMIWPSNLEKSKARIMG